MNLRLRIIIEQKSCTHILQEINISLGVQSQERAGKQMLAGLLR